MTIPVRTRAMRDAAINDGATHPTRAGAQGAQTIGGYAAATATPMWGTGGPNALARDSPTDRIRRN